MTEEQGRQQLSISLPQAYKRALEWLSARSGSDNKSAVVRQLVEERMRKELGARWQSKIG